MKNNILSMLSFCFIFIFFGSSLFSGPIISKEREFDPEKYKKNFFDERSKVRILEKKNHIGFDYVLYFLMDNGMDVLDNFSVEELCALHNANSIINYC